MEHRKGSLKFVNFWRIIIKFFIVAGGGTLLGVTFGFFGSFVFKFTKHFKLIEPLLLFTICYLSYLTAELMDLSAILSIIFCSFVMMHRCAQNVSIDSHLGKMDLTMKFHQFIVIHFCRSLGPRTWVQHT